MGRGVALQNDQIHEGCTERSLGVDPGYYCFRDPTRTSPDFMREKAPPNLLTRLANAESALFFGDPALILPVSLTMTLTRPQFLGEGS